MHGLEHDTGCQFTWLFFLSFFSIQLCSPLQRSFIRSSVYSLRMRPARPVLNVLAFYFVLSLLNSREFLAIAVCVRLASSPRVHSLQHSIQYFFFPFSVSGLHSSAQLCAENHFLVWIAHSLIKLIECDHRLVVACSTLWPYTMQYACLCVTSNSMINIFNNLNCGCANEIKSLPTFIAGQKQE